MKNSSLRLVQFSPNQKGERQNQNVIENESSKFELITMRELLDPCGVWNLNEPKLSGIQIDTRHREAISVPSPAAASCTPCYSQSLFRVCDTYNNQARSFTHPPNQNHSQYHFKFFVFQNGVRKVGNDTASDAPCCLLEFWTLFLLHFLCVRGLVRGFWK